MSKFGKTPFTFKVCIGCGVEKHRSEYYKKGDTVSHKCKPCSLADSKSRAPKYFGKYSDYRNELRRTKYATDEAYRAAFQAKKKAA